MRINKLLLASFLSTAIFISSFGMDDEKDKQDLIGPRSQSDAFTLSKEYISISSKKIELSQTAQNFWEILPDIL